MPYLDHTTVMFEARFFVTLAKTGRQDANRCRADIDVRPETIEHWSSVVKDPNESEEVRSYFRWAIRRNVTFRKAVLREFNKLMEKEHSHGTLKQPGSHLVGPKPFHYPLPTHSHADHALSRVA